MANYKGADCMPCLRKTTTSLVRSVRMWEGEQGASAPGTCHVSAKRSVTRGADSAPLRDDRYYVVEVDGKPSSAETGTREALCYATQSAK